MNSLKLLFASVCLSALSACATKKPDSCCTAATDDCCKIKSSCCAGETHKPKK